VTGLRSLRFGVGQRAGNRQLDLRAGIGVAPDRQLAAGQFGAFLHARQAVMSGAASRLQKLCVDALSIVADPQAEFPLVIPDFHLNPPGVGVPEGIAHRFARNAVDLVPYQRQQISRFTLHFNAKCGARLAFLIGNQLFSELADRLRQVVGDYRRGA
jgi:hypothetical protein